MPLYWGETKPCALFEGLLANYKADFVLDLSCSLQLAQACLRKNIKYVGACLTEDHCNWAQNVINLAAIRVICDSQHSLHSDSLAPLLQQHFPDQLMEDPQDGEACPATPPENA